MSPRFCSACGAGIDPYAKFCPMCGQKVVEVQQEEGRPVGEDATSRSEIPQSSEVCINTAADGEEKSPVKKSSKKKAVLAVVWVVLLAMAIIFEGVTSTVGVIAFFVAPIFFLVFIIQAIRKKGAKKWVLAWAVSLLTFFGMMVIEEVVCRHEWEEATCQAPQTCSICGKTDGDILEHDWQEATCQNPQKCSLCGETQGHALEHSPGNKVTSSTDMVKATVTTQKTCSVCGEAVDSQTVSLKKLHDGEQFLTTPKEFSERMGNKLKEIQGCELKTRVGEVNGKFAFGVLLDGKKVGAFMFTNSDGDALVSTEKKNVACFGKILGTVDMDYIAEVILALIETCDPSLSFSAVKAVGTDLLEDKTVTKNGITYVFTVQSDGALLGASIS